MEAKLAGCPFFAGIKKFEAPDRSKSIDQKKSKVSGISLPQANEKVTENMLSAAMNAFS